MRNRERNRKPRLPNPEGTQEVYPEGTPVDDNDMPISGAEISESVAKRLPLDAESARILQNSKGVLARKARGDRNVRWDADNRQKFIDAKRLYPTASVSICQVAPHTDDNIDPRPLSAFMDYYDVVRYVRDKHWKGEQATYTYKIYDIGQPQWATGKIEFGPDPEWALKKSGAHQEDDMSRRDPYGGYPPPGYPPPYFGYPYGQPPPQYQQPPPQYPQQQYGQYQQQPPPQQQVAPPPAAPPPMQMPLPPASSTESQVVQHLIGQIERLSSMYASLYEQVRYEQHARPPGYPPPPQQHMGQPPPFGQPMPPQPPYGYTAERAMRAETEKPKSVLEQMKEAVDTMQAVTKMVKSISDENTPEQPEKPEEKKLDENSPFKIQELPHMRFVTTKEGDPVDTMTTMMFNGDKIKDFAKSVLDGVQEMMQKRNKDSEHERQQTLQAMREAVEIRKQLAQPPAASPRIPAAPAPPQPQPVQAPASPASVVARAFGAVGKPKVVVDYPLPRFEKAPGWSEKPVEVEAEPPVNSGSTS